MKLSDIEPRWTASTKGRHGMGISFLCPVHRNHRLAVAFAEPLDGGSPMPGVDFLWKRQGDTFDNLTLGPCVDASGRSFGTMDDGSIKTPCWHGFITNGEISGSPP